MSGQIQRDTVLALSVISILLGVGRNLMDLMGKPAPSPVSAFIPSAGFSLASSGRVLLQYR